MPRYGYDGYDSYGYDMAPYAPGGFNVFKDVQGGLAR